MTAKSMIYPVGGRPLVPRMLYRLSAVVMPNIRLTGGPRFIVPDYVRRGLNVVAFTSDHMRKTEGLRLSLWVTVELPITLRGAFECECEVCP